MTRHHAGDKHGSNPDCELRLTHYTSRLRLMFHRNVDIGRKRMSAWNLIA